MKNRSTLWWIIGITVVVVGLVAWSRFLQNNDPDVVVRDGLHWHPRLTIYVRDVKQEIPANIGLGAVHLPMHTHVEDAAQGIIHLEFSGRVANDDLKLGNFFKNWDRDMRSFGENMLMTVDGVENSEYEDYLLRDKDVIELRYD